MRPCQVKLLRSDGVFATWDFASLQHSILRTCESTGGASWCPPWLSLWERVPSRESMFTGGAMMIFDSGREESCVSGLVTDPSNRSMKEF